MPKLSSYFFILMIFGGGSLWATRLPQVRVDCQGELQKAVELSRAPFLPTITLQDVPALFRKTKHIEFKVGEVSYGESYKVLRNIINLRVPVYRSGIKIGELGRAQNGRYALLQPASREGDKRALQAGRWALFNRIAETVPVFGLLQTGAEYFWVRPLISGWDTFARLGQLSPALNAGQYLTLEKLRAELDALFPALVRTTYVGDANWVEAYEHEMNLNGLSFAENKIISLSNFLDDLEFVSTHDGRLLIENFEDVPTRPKTGFIVQDLSEARAWVFERWNWYRFLALSKMPEEQIQMITRPEKEARNIAFMFNLSVLNSIAKASPFWPKDRVLSFRDKVSFIVDSEVPFTRPQTLAFKKNSKLKYHFAKHAAEFGVTTAEDYIASALAFVNEAPSSSRRYFIRANGDIVLVDGQSATLAVFSEAGLLRTYMRPDDSQHLHTHNIYYYLELLFRESGDID